MGIAWLWYYTNSANPDVLAAANERRAFTVCSRWRSMLRWVGTLRDGYRQRRDERAGQRDLRAMSDHLLRDIGLWRDGTTVRRIDPDPVVPLVRQRRSVTGRLHGSVCVGSPAAIADDVSSPSLRVDPACRAA